MRDPVSLSAFAEEIGCRPSYVTALKKAGRLVLTDDGKRVKVEESLKLIETTRSGQPQHAAAARAHAERRNGEPPRDDDPAQPNSRAYWERREAAARAETREIELRRLKGELVETETVQGAGTEIGTAVRTVLENLADQLAPALAADPDEPSVHRRLREELDQALHDIITRIEATLHDLAKEEGR